MIPNWGVVDTLEGRTAILRDLNKVEKWSDRSVKFKKGNCKVLSLERNNLMHQYMLKCTGKKELFRKGLGS